MRVLLVEDEENIRESVKLNLELDGFEVVEAKTGREGLNRFKSEHFDLIILDIMLPELTGLDVCEQIRLTNLKVPILMLTAKGEPEDRIAGLKKELMIICPNHSTWMNYCFEFKI
ncbi:MAG: response regulator [Saprospiraceae bacterium]